VVVEPGISPAVDAKIAADACYRFANEGVRFKLAERCAKTIAAAGQAVDNATLARLNGTIQFATGDQSGAAPLLAMAAAKFDLLTDPRLHLRLATAQRARGDNEAACTTAKSVFRVHPMLPGIKKLLEACVSEGRDLVAVLEEQYDTMKKEMVAGRINGKPVVPQLTLEDPNQQSKEVALFEAGKVTVALFFSTWCPHCALELPHVTAFKRLVESKKAFSDRIRVVAVRTAVEQEVVPYETFINEAKPNFQIWTDPVMSLGFSKFAKSQDLPPALPTLAVINDRGFIKYILPPGDFRDTARELVWAVNDLLKNPDAIVAPVDTTEAPPPPAAAGAEPAAKAN
jgi:thiol-disulfide isomerase/thioredoxin